MATLLASLVALTVLGAAPVAAQDEVVCKGGGPDYWLENSWPAAFKVPYKFRRPNGKPAVVRKWTKFDAVFRYRGGRDQEGKIFPGKTLNQVLKMKGTPKKGLARNAIAALLNAGAKPDNNFWPTKFRVIKGFQVYWDGTEDMGKRKARLFMKRTMAQWNQGACP
jgi:hypothetical protein